MEAEPVLQRVADSRPFVIEDRVNARVPDRAIVEYRVLSQNAVQLRAERLDGVPGLAVVEVGAELHTRAVQLVESSAEQQQLSDWINRRTLVSRTEPGGADLQSPVNASASSARTAPPGPRCCGRSWRRQARVTCPRSYPRKAWSESVAPLILVNCSSRSWTVSFFFSSPSAS